MPEDGSVLIKIIGDASEFTDTLNGIAKKGAGSLRRSVWPRWERRRWPLLAHS